MIERIGYRFIFRAPGEEPVIVRHDTRPGDAEDCARRLARTVARRLGWPEAVCVWMGPVGTEIPARIREELRREATT